MCRDVAGMRIGKRYKLPTYRHDEALRVYEPLNQL